jgi:hypothetical protein
LRFFYDVTLGLARLPNASRVKFKFAKFELVLQLAFGALIPITESSLRDGISFAIPTWQYR